MTITGLGLRVVRPSPTGTAPARHHLGSLIAKTIVTAGQPCLRLLGWFIPYAGLGD